MTTKAGHDTHGIPADLLELIANLEEPDLALDALDGIILRLGPHHVGHFIATSQDRDAAERLKGYLERHWPAYFVLIERLIRAARREHNEELMSDFGQS